MGFVFLTGGRRDEIVVDRVGGQVCAAEGGGEYEGYCEGASESEFGGFREGVEGL
jgi:hypothetical protein